MLKPSAHVVHGLVQVLLRYVIRKLRDLADGCGSRASGLVSGALGLVSAAFGLVSAAFEFDRAAVSSAAITVEPVGKKAKATRIQESCLIAIAMVSFKELAP